MKRYIIAAFALACLFVSPAMADSGSALYFAAPETSNDLVYRSALYDPSTFAPAKSQDRVQTAQAITTQSSTSTVTPTQPAEVTTTVKGGTLAAQIIEWLQVAFGSALGAAFLAVVLKGLTYLGIQITTQQRAQLQSIVVNGINDAAAKAEVSLINNPKLDIQIKSQIVADAVKYTQDHAAETIKALGLDPKSGDAIKVIQARIETALNDPATPTPAAITPPSGMSTVNGVIVQGAKA